MGPPQSDVTEWRADQALWDSEAMPDIIYVFERPTYWLPENALEEPPPKTYRIYGEFLRDIPILPDHISSKVEGWRLEAWFRMDPRVGFKDIMDRMQPSLRGSRTTYQMRMDRFRGFCNVLGWVTKGKKFDGHRRALRAKLIAAGIPTSLNTTRGLSWGLINVQRGEVGGKIPVPGNIKSREKMWVESRPAQPSIVPSSLLSNTVLSPGPIMRAGEYSTPNQSLMTPLQNTFVPLSLPSNTLYGGGLMVPDVGHLAPHAMPSVTSANPTTQFFCLPPSASSNVVGVPGYRQQPSTFCINSYLPNQDICEVPEDYPVVLDQEPRNPFEFDFDPNVDFPSLKRKMSSDTPTAVGSPKRRRVHGVLVDRTQAVYKQFGMPEEKVRKQIPAEIRASLESNATPEPVFHFFEQLNTKYHQLTTPTPSIHPSQSIAPKQLVPPVPHVQDTSPEAVIVNYGADTLMLKIDRERHNPPLAHLQILRRWHPAGSTKRGLQLEYILDPIRAKWGWSDNHGYEKPVVDTQPELGQFADAEDVQYEFSRRQIENTIREVEQEESSENLTDLIPRMAWDNQYGLLRTLRE